MQSLTPYLVFPGNCREAMGFYSETLGGEITIMQTFGESPVPAPPEAEERIFNSEVRAGGIVIKASDNMPGQDLVTGTNFSLFVSFADQQDKRARFEKLADGGSIMFPIDDNFGMLRDKYGIQWMFVSIE